MRGNLQSAAFSVTRQEFSAPAARKGNRASSAVRKKDRCFGNNLSLEKSK
jgi:hypothetical protein